MTEDKMKYKDYVDECKKIVDLAQKNNTIVAVGHSERCNPVVQAMKRLNIERNQTHDDSHRPPLAEN